MRRRRRKKERAPAAPSTGEEEEHRVTMWMKSWPHCRPVRAASSPSETTTPSRTQGRGEENRAEAEGSCIVSAPSRCPASAMPSTRRNTSRNYAIAAACHR